MKTVHYTATFVGPWHDGNRPFTDGATVLTEKSLAVKPSLDEPLSKTTVSGTFDSEPVADKTEEVSLTIEVSDRNDARDVDQSIDEGERYKYRVSFQVKTTDGAVTVVEQYLDERVEQFADFFSLSEIDE